MCVRMRMIMHMCAFACDWLPSRPLKIVHVQMASMRQWKYSKNMLRCVEVWWWKAVFWTWMHFSLISKHCPLSYAHNSLPFSLSRSHYINPHLYLCIEGFFFQWSFCLLITSFPLFSLCLLFLFWWIVYSFWLLFALKFMQEDIKEPADD